MWAGWQGAAAHGHVPAGQNRACPHAAVTLGLYCSSEWTLYRLQMESVKLITPGWQTPICFPPSPEIQLVYGDIYLMQINI